MIKKNVHDDCELIQRQKSTPRWSPTPGKPKKQILELLRIYGSELREDPFPRSEKAVGALAQFRGCNSGFEYAEGFELLREIS